MWDCMGVSQLTYFFLSLRLILQGVVKPDITFFGEDLPKRFYFYMRDMLQSDLVIVMGTSLEVGILSCYISESVNFTVLWGKKFQKFWYPCLCFKTMFILFMKVQPFAGIIDSVKWGVPRVLFNMHAVGPFKYQRRAQDFISPGNSVSLEIRVISL